MPDLLDGIGLVDHHCHGVFREPLDRLGFESNLTEADAPGPLHGSLMDSQAGLAVRRFCPPLLDLSRHVPAEDYLARRAELGAAEVNRRMVAATGTRTFLVDTGYLPEPITTPACKTRVGTPLCSRISPTSTRERRCADRVASSGCRPPR